MDEDKVIKSYMKLLNSFRIDGYTNGINDGYNNTIKESVKRLLKENIDISIIAKVTDLPTDDIKALKQD